MCCKWDWIVFKNRHLSKFNSERNQKIQFMTPSTHHDRSWSLRCSHTFLRMGWTTCISHCMCLAFPLCAPKKRRMINFYGSSYGGKVKTQGNIVQPNIIMLIYVDLDSRPKSSGTPIEMSLTTNSLFIYFMSSHWSSD